MPGPRFAKFGVRFIWYVEWDIINEEFGAAISIVGTLISAGIALLMAVPLAFGIAVFLTETCPVWLRRPLGTAIELLAAVPSIIYGMFGLFVFRADVCRLLQVPLQECSVACRWWAGCSGVPPTDWASGGRHHPGLHGAALRRRGDARRVRNHAAHPARVGLRPGLHHLGGGAQGGAALHPEGCHRRHHARPGAAPWAKPWP
jgi:hypothetical protein